MNDGAQKQQIVEKIKASSNILVTVSANPSVDELSAALGLTILLNNMKKHATAVFSGAIPPAITFLDPEKTFESTVDSLRDFIIALDKEKADHLRYKVEGDVVKIFITPYRTTITGDDLEFSQGDYNVELVLALGVKDKESLDEALTAHGRILHDATVTTLTAGTETSNLGTVDWHEANASSLSEMVVSLADSLKKDKTVLDEQTATAFLTGIVSATDRFSNPKTSSKVMTVAAQLMAAGANQQLIASKLQEANDIGPGAEPKSTRNNTTNSNENSDGTTDLSEGEPTKLNRKERSANKSVTEVLVKKDDGSLSISHEKQGDVDEVAAATAIEDQAEALDAVEEKLEEDRKKVETNQQTDATKEAEESLAKQLDSAPQAAAGAISVADLQKDLAEASADVTQAAKQVPSAAQASNEDAEPAFGGTLNATTEEAAESKRREINDDRNRTILSHTNGDYAGSSAPKYQAPLNSSMAPVDEPASIDPFHDNDAAITNPTSYATTIEPPVVMSPPEPTIDLFAAPPPASEPVMEFEETPAPTLADIDQQNREPHADARDAVAAAFGATPFQPSLQPTQAPVDFSQQSAPVSTLPPLPDFSTLPPLPAAPEYGAPAGPVPSDKLGDIFGAAPLPVQNAPTPNNPGQFKIPGQ